MYSIVQKEKYLHKVCQFVEYFEWLEVGIITIKHSYIRIIK